MSRFC